MNIRISIFHLRMPSFSFERNRNFVTQKKQTLTKILPFRAIRPTRDKAHLVATMPYYTYKKNVLEAKMEQNPYTFLHVINPEFNELEKSVPNSTERFQKTRQKFEEFIQEGIFIRDNEPSLYLYRQTKDGHEYLGLIGGASVEQYLTGHIKKHEETITSREQTFSNYLDCVRFNAEPVLLFHQKHEPLSALLNAITEHRPEYEFTSTERIKHEVWVISSTEAISQIQSFYTEIKDVYIADGHHRCASSARFTMGLKGEKSPEQEHFLAYFISEEKLFILDYNRLITDLGSFTQGEFLEKIGENFHFLPVNFPEARPKRVHQLAMYMDHQWYRLEPRTGKFEAEHPVSSLDTAILTDLLLKPILGISDLKTDERIDFMSGNKGIQALADAVDSGSYKVGFALYPVSAQQLKKVSDENLIMPPKSTWIEPKLRSGLTIYPLD